MDKQIATPSPAPTARLSRRRALTAYAPPVLATIGVASTLTFGQSGRVQVRGEVNGEVNQGDINGTLQVAAEAEL